MVGTRRRGDGGEGGGTGHITSPPSWGWVEKPVILLVRETDVTPGNRAVIRMRFHLGSQAPPQGIHPL